MFLNKSAEIFSVHTSFFFFLLFFYFEQYYDQRRFFVFFSIISVSFFKVSKFVTPSLESPGKLCGRSWTGGQHFLLGFQTRPFEHTSPAAQPLPCYLSGVFLTFWLYLLPSGCGTACQVEPLVHPSDGPPYNSRFTLRCLRFVRCLQIVLRLLVCSTLSFVLRCLVLIYLYVSPFTSNLLSTLRWTYYVLLFFLVIYINILDKNIM